MIKRWIHRHTITALRNERERLTVAIDRARKDHSRTAPLYRRQAIVVGQLMGMKA